MFLVRSSQQRVCPASQMQSYTHLFLCMPKVREIFFTNVSKVRYMYPLVCHLSEDDLSSKMSYIRWCVLLSIMSYVRWWFHDPTCHKSDDNFIIQYVARKVNIFFIQKVRSQMMFCHLLCHKWDDIFFIQKIRSQMMPSLSSILSQVPYVFVFYQVYK